MIIEPTPDWTKEQEDKYKKAARQEPPEQWTNWQYISWYFQVVVVGFFRWCWAKLNGR